MSTTDPDKPTSSAEGGLKHIAMTGGNLRIPPSYFIQDMITALKPYRTTLHCQRLVVAADGSPMASVTDERMTAKQVRASIVAERPDLVHQHWATWSGPARRAATELDVPLVVSVHGYDAYLPRRGSIPMRALRGFKRWDRFHALRQAERVLVNSEHMYRRLLGLGVSESRLVLVPHGLDTDAFSPPSEATARTGILYAGRLSPEKGLGLLLDALSRIPRERYELLTIAGRGALESTLRSQAGALGVAVNFVGQLSRSEVIQAMQGARCLVIPSVPGYGQEEASGLAPLEGMACGTPVVVTRVGGLPENIPDDYAELICDPDIDAMVRSINAAMELDHESRTSLRKVVVEKSSISSLGLRLKSVYRGVGV